MLSIPLETWAIRIRVADSARSASLAWIVTPTVRRCDFVLSLGMRSLGSGAVVRSTRKSDGIREVRSSWSLSFGSRDAASGVTPCGRYEHRAGLAKNGPRAAWPRLS
jgi:hypothetical protein